MKNLIIIGAGGVGQETALLVEKINESKKEWNLFGYVDDNLAIQGKTVCGYPVIGTIDDLVSLRQSGIYVVVSIANYHIKKKIVDRVKENPFLTFATIIHPDVEINRTIEIGEGTIIYPNVIMTANIKIGKHCIISPKTGIGHGSIIGDFSNLLWNTNISGDVKIHEGVYVGSGATIIQQLDVGKGSTIGAGAVVIRNVPEERTVVGVPARAI